MKTKLIEILILTVSLISVSTSQCMMKPFIRCCCPLVTSIFIAGAFAKIEDKVQKSAREYSDELLDKVFGEDDAERRRRRNQHNDDDDRD